MSPQWADPSSQKVTIIPQILGSQKKRGFNDLYLQHNFFDKMTYNRVIRKVTLCCTALSPLLSAFHPPLSNKEVLLNLGMKCWNSAFNAQGFESNYSSCTGRSSENICSSSAGAQEKRKHQFTTKIGGKTSLGPSYFSSLEFWKGIYQICSTIVMV